MSNESTQAAPASPRQKLADLKRIMQRMISLPGEQWELINEAFAEIDAALPAEAPAPAPVKKAKR